MQRLGRVPALDGLRGLAIAAVCGFHFFGLTGGFLGVDVFFVLSGFLITTLLLEEREKRGRIDVAAFYRRRVRRLLPALGLLVTVAVGVAWASDGAEHAAVVAGLGLYSVNFVRAFFTPYVPQPVGPLWSLGQEEQFYLLWPLLLIVLLKRWPTRAITVGLGVLFLLLVLYRYGLAASGSSWNRLYFGPDTHTDGLVLGSLAAFLRQAGLRVNGTSGWIALWFLILLFFEAHDGNLAVASVGIPIAEVASAVLVLAVLNPGPLRTVFAFAPVVWLGAISYSLYLWQGFGLDRGGIVLAVVMALISYYGVERRFRQRPLATAPPDGEAETVPPSRAQVYEAAG